MPACRRAAEAIRGACEDRDLAGPGGLCAFIALDVGRQDCIADAGCAADGGLELNAILANESALNESIGRGDRVWCALHASDLVVVRAT